MLKAAANKPVQIELKSGETYNGILSNIDGYMNLNLRDAILTSRDGENFFKLANIYVRGICIKYIRLRNEVIQQVAGKEYVPSKLL